MPWPCHSALVCIPYFTISELSRTRLEGLAPLCLNHLEMAETETAGQLERLAQGVDLAQSPFRPRDPGG